MANRLITIDDLAKIVHEQVQEQIELMRSEGCTEAQIEQFLIAMTWALARAG